MTDIEIVPIGRPVASQLREKLEASLLEAAPGQRTLPSAVLWGDDAALKLYEQYQALPEVYATRDETALLRRWGADISRHIASGSVLIDLGCGDVNKVKPLLDALEAAGKEIQYYALDLSDHALRRNLAKLRAMAYQHVRCSGLWGTFDDVRTWAANEARPIVYLSLGSIFGNDEFDIAVRDLRVWRDALRRQDLMLLGVDGSPDPDQVWKSLNTRVPGVPHLVEHGLALSNAILGHEWYRPHQWQLAGVCKKHDAVCTHQWVVTAVEDNVCAPLGFRAAKGEQIRTVKWFRWGPDGMRRQFDAAGLELVGSWSSPTGPVYEYLVRPGQ